MTANEATVIADAAVMLDANRPDWFTLVNPDTLRMASMMDCVLGQVYGGYLVGFARLFGTMRGDDRSDPRVMAFSGSASSTLWTVEVDARRATDRNEVAA